MEHESVDQRQIERQMPGYVFLTDQRSNDHRNLFFLLFESFFSAFQPLYFQMESTAFMAAFPDALPLL